MASDDGHGRRTLTIAVVHTRPVPVALQMGKYRPGHRTLVQTDRDGADHAAAVPPRLWTVEEANARLTELRALLPQLKAWASRLGVVHEELQRLATFWGKELESNDNPDFALRHRLDEIS